MPNKPWGKRGRKMMCSLCGATDKPLKINIAESTKASVNAGYMVKYSKVGKLSFPIDVYVCEDCNRGPKKEQSNG